jgi:hypothetical protein
MMTRKRVAFVYDTANVLSRINDGKIEVKHVLSPLIARHPAWLSVIILPVFERDLSRVERWDDLLKCILSFAERGVGTFDAYKGEDEFCDELDMLKLSLKALKKIEDEAGRLASLKPAGAYDCYLVVDRAPRRKRAGEETRDLLVSSCGKLKECEDANPDEAVGDLEMYFLPYLNLLSGYVIVLVTDDACFRRLVEVYSKQRGLSVRVLDVGALAELKRLRGALRSNSSASL